jgi:hypothetical protein
MKRQSDTNKWDKSWFRQLSPKHKALWEYLRDKCDAVGVIEANYEMFSFFVNDKITEVDIAVFGNRIVKLPSGKLLIRKFVQFHYGKLTETSPPHRTYLKLIDKHGIADILAEEYDEENDITASQKKVAEKPPEPEIVYPYNDQRFIDAWIDWLAYRRATRKMYKTIKSQQAQLDWFKENNFTVEVAIEIIKTSIRNSYQGLFKPRENGQPAPTDKKGTSASRIDKAKNW